ncbi:formylglycine-generating enzyme family protein, partial [Pseudorhodoferax sp.]|uniref:formylglycine-generating enzyme family protein n=1 Tax=Pseudorhodoferax sp. TaxID=1993553 RepID=UPI002DD61EDC
MHGNVWEWCADGRREYDGASQVDPRGPTGDERVAPRAVRGGSWLDHPRRLRAAYRLDGRRGRRGGILGFRFSLRSTSGPDGSAERPPEATVAPEGPQGKSPAPGRGRGEGVSEGSSARRFGGPTTMLDRLKAKLGFASKPDQSEEE